MLPLLAPLLLTFSAFTVPDTSAWLVRLDLSSSGALEIPGKDDFHEPEGRPFDMNEPRASAFGGALRVALHTPEWRRWTAHAAVAVGERTRSWDGVVVNSLYLVVPLPDKSGATDLEARMTATAPVAEFALGTDWHPWRRHFFGLEVVLPVQLADGDLKYEVDDEEIHSGRAPSSFREAAIPRLMATYDYRLFDRIDLGFGVSLLHGDYFAETPEADIDSLGRIRLENGSNGAWIELHAGWTFGRAKP